MKEIDYKKVDGGYEVVVNGETCYLYYVNESLIVQNFIAVIEQLELCEQVRV